MFAKRTSKKSLEELFQTYISSDEYTSWQDRVIENLLNGIGKKVNQSSLKAVETQSTSERDRLAKEKKIKEDRMLFIALLMNQQQETLKQNITNIFSKMKNDAFKWMEKQSAIRRIKFKLFGKDRTEELAKYLKKKNFPYADTIARTNTSRMNTNMIQETSKAVGVIAYIWDSTMDRKTRTSHRLMNNVIVFWDEKPVPGKYEGKYPNTRTVHAGEDYNCRCLAKPIFDWNYLLKSKSTYRVWLNGAIQNISRNRLKELVQNRMGVEL